MQCPRCNRAGYQPYAACQGCGFSGPPASVEELGHVAHLLGEIDTWHQVEAGVRERLRGRYQRRRRELEVALGLRQPPLGADETRRLHWRLFCLAGLEKEVAHWLAEDWLAPGAAGTLRREIDKQRTAVQERLAAAAPGSTADRSYTVRNRLKRLDYVAEILHRAHLKGLFDDDAWEQAQAHLEAQRRELEVQAGLRPAPVEAHVPPPDRPARRAVPPLPVPKPRPREPITWERVWQTLLSERTLNVLLFLGAFLLMASATTYVVYNWEKLPPLVQLAFIVLFTLFFYGAGWFLRQRMELRASGLAFSALGSLLVPLDFYAIFLAGGLWPAESWPWVWLAASAVCLPLYALTAVRLQAPFFGYLVAIAAGNLLCAGLEVAGVERAWWLAALAALSLVATALAYRLRSARRPWRIVAGPLRFSALVATSALLPLGLAWWLVAGAAGLAFDLSLALAWVLGASLYAYAARRQESALLGSLAGAALPLALALTLRLAFEALDIEPAWHALGWAALVPLYLWQGRRWLASAAGGGQAVVGAWGRTATGLGLALMVLAAAWAVADLWAAAATHAVLAAGAGLAIYLWQRPRTVPLASLLGLSAMTFAMAGLHLEPAELCLGWALLSVLHVLAALRLSGTGEETVNRLISARLFAAAPLLAALALLPPLVLGHDPLLTYALGNWIGLSAWLLWLDHRGEWPGLGDVLARLGRLRASALHWALAVPLPFFVALVYSRFQAPDAWLGIAVAAAGWALAGVGFRLAAKSEPLAGCRWAWLAAGWGSSLAGVGLAWYHHDQALVGLALLLAAGLYFVSARALDARLWLIPGGMALPLGLLVLLDLWQVPWARQSAVLAAVAAGYLLAGIGREALPSRWQLGPPRRFMRPLAAVGHLLAAAAVVQGLAPGVEHVVSLPWEATALPWPDAARLWAAAGQVLLGGTYGLLAWFHGRERWGHAAAWLGVLSGGLVATAYSQGRGSSAFKAALLAAAYVLAERLLARSRARQAWRLYRRPLLVAGWAVSAGAVGLALVRNLLLLGGGQTREMWAAAGILAVALLYLISARLFRRRLFLWPAAVLLFLPWTILTLWGWFLWPAPPDLPHYAPAWAVLAALELAAGLALTANGARDARGRDYGLPLRAVANGLMALVLLWAPFDAATSTIAWGLGLAFYLVSAAADHRRGLEGWHAARFLYPAVLTALVWPLYLLNHLLPRTPNEVLGLLLLLLDLPLLAAGRRLRRIDPADGLPLYLGAGVAALAGTLLVAGRPALLALALAYDAALCLIVARLSRGPAWLYPAAALGSGALLAALATAGVPLARRGWWLAGLGAVCLAQAWLLERAGKRPYAMPALVAALAVPALGLLPSALDDVGAFWGFLAVAALYALTAAWRRLPLLLTPAAALLAVPYAVALTWLEVPPADYGLALFPGVAAALALAHLLDRVSPLHPAAGRPAAAWLLEWWAAPFYAWGYLAAAVAVALSWPDPARLAAALALAAATALHATWRFRQRGSLLAAGLLAQAAVVSAIDAAGWLAHPAWTALAFLPATLVTAALALGIELERGEGSPLSSPEAAWAGWSRPLYLLLAADLLGGQLLALYAPRPGAVVTVAHALILAVLATTWAVPWLAAGSAGLGIAGLIQGLVWAGVGRPAYAVGFALLALVYGLAAYGLLLSRPGSRLARTWQSSLEWAGLGLSAAALGWLLLTSLDLVELVVLTFLGRLVGFEAYEASLRAAMWVLALLGLLYLAAAVARRQWRVGYGAVALLLASWGLWWRFFQGMAAFQWYAVPAGIYLLGVGWLEWRQGQRGLARWADRAGMLVWLGSAWWQSLPGVAGPGWPYALLMGAEALLLVWWGSARRQKRFLYTGVVAVVLDAVTQSIEPLLSANRWIVFGIVGVLLLGLGLLVERRLEAVREFSLELRERLEAWE